MSDGKPENCTHLLYPRCGCAPHAVDRSPPAPQYPSALEEQVERDRVLRRALTNKLKKAARPARPGPLPSPWRVRSEVQETLRSQELAVMVNQLNNPEELARLGTRVQLSYARRHFATFCRLAWHTIEPGTTLDWGWHHELICNTLQSLFEGWLRARDFRVPGDVRNTVFNLPPGSLKSRLIAVFFPCWVWLRCSSVKFICLSVNEDACLRDARAMRDVIRHAWYQESFGPSWTLKADQDAISNFGNTEGGERLSRASGSEIVGLRGDILLIDDPNNPLEAENKTERDKVNMLWDTNQYNRVNNGVRSLRIGVQQRTNALDWTGHVIKRQGLWSPENPDGWLWVVLPAEFEQSRKYLMPETLRAELRRVLPGVPLVVEDPRTSEGESVHPERFTKDYLASERKRWEGTGNYAGQMQQRPAAAAGERIKQAYWGWCRLDGGVREHYDGQELGRPRPAGCHDGEARLIKVAHHRPEYWEFDWIVISIDAAAKKTERGSNWGILVIGAIGARRFILDDRTRRGDILEILSTLKSAVRDWMPDKILIEDKAAGPDLVTMLTNQMAEGDLPMVVVEVTNPGSAGKEERLDAVLPTIANGMVSLLDGAPWLEELVEEMSMFPHGAYNDRVDALTQVLAWNADIATELPEW